MFEKIVEKFSTSAISWIGSMNSLLIHTLLFAFAFLLYFTGIYTINEILLVLTTIVSLEAIYLAIFIQMSVNLQSKKLQNVAQEVEELQENVEDIQENVEDIQENVEDIQEDVEEIQKEDEEDSEEDDEILIRIEKTMELLMKEVMELKKQQKKSLIK
jgi:biopolymer transport protein ExbB/TolQ